MNVLIFLLGSITSICTYVYIYIYISTYIHNENYKDVHREWFSAIRYNPWISYSLGPGGVGYTERDSFVLFMRLGNKFGPRYITRRTFYSLEENIRDYWDFYLECDALDTPLMFKINRGKQRFHIDKKEGLPIFNSSYEMIQFFYSSGNYNQSLDELLYEDRNELVRKIQVLLNEKGFK